VRVVAGSARGRRLVTPPGDDVRPTLDRVREAVFNALGSMDVVRDAAVLDVFAGSGALGIEALSRGARSATFVDTARGSLEAVRTNLDTTGLSSSATVRRGDAVALLAEPAALGGPFDLVLADPPYSFDRWVALLVALGPVLAHDAIVVVESDRPLDDEAREAWADLGGGILRERRYGGTVVVMLSFQGQPSLPSSLGPADPADPGAVR
jgi:16S rRNA (guanine966-N2)-methyltransferase